MVNMIMRTLYLQNINMMLKETKVLKPVNRKEMRTSIYRIKYSNKEGTTPASSGMHRHADTYTWTLFQLASTRARQPPKTKTTSQPIKCGPHLAQTMCYGETYSIHYKAAFLGLYTSNLVNVNSFEYFLKQYRNIFRLSLQEHQVYLHLPALSREAKHNCYGRKTNNQKVGYRDEHGVAQRVGCLTQPAISRSSSINRERLLFNTHSKPKKCDFEFRFCQKCYKPPQNIKSGFSRQEKNRLIHSTQPNVQTAKNIEVTGSTTKREIIEVTQINTQTGHSQHRTPATTSNKMDALQSCDRCMSKSCEQSMAEQSRTPPHGSTLCHSQKEITLPKTTPYGPNNLPHMVLCTKKGPDNA